MGYVVFQNGKEYGARKGLEGPFSFVNGMTLYYDPLEGKYYDPTSDWYIEHDEMAIIQNQLIEALRK